MAFVLEHLNELWLTVGLLPRQSVVITSVMIKIKKIKKKIKK